MNFPLFSILIANYNSGSYFKDCFDSIVNQTYTNIEVVIVDDCSTDGSFDIIQKMIQDNSRFRVFKNEKNYGCGYTKSRCAALAKGDVCGFLDSDDALKDDAIEIMVNQHITNSQCSLIYSQFWVCNEQLEPQYIQFTDQQPKDISILDVVYVSHFATYKNALYKKTKGMNPMYLRAVDRDLYYNLAEVGDILFIQDVLYFYRIHSKNISLNENGMKAIYWDWIVKHDHAARKGYNMEVQFTEYYGDFVRLPNKNIRKLYNYCKKIYHRILILKLKKRTKLFLEKNR